MANIGEGDRLLGEDIPHITTILIRESTLVKDRNEFFNALGVTDSKIVQWEMEFKRLNLSPYEIFALNLHSWLSENGNKATLSKLCQTLRTINNALSAETLEREFPLSNATRTGACWPIWFNMGQPNKNFVGRCNQLNQLDNIMSKANQNLIVISGLGGIGKTELTRKFAFELQKKSDTSCTCFDSETAQSFYQSLLSLAIENNIQTNSDANENETSYSLFTRLVSSFCKTKNTSFWLVVFDNVDEINSDIRACLQLLRATKNTLTILTSRNLSIANEDFEVITLDVWEAQDAVEFVKRSLPSDIQIKDASIEKLCQRLGNFALAMQQSMAYIVQQQRTSIEGTSYSISDYITEFDEGGKKTSQLLDHKLSEISHPFAKTTYTVWDITIAKVKSCRKIGETASSIFNNIAYFESSSIPFDFIERTAKIKQWSPAMVNSMQFNQFMQPVFIQDAVSLLKRYSLINADRCIVTCHRLVQEVFRLKLQESKEDSAILRHLLQLLHSFSPFSKSDVIHVYKVWKYSSVKKQLVQQFPNMPSLIFDSLKVHKLYSEMNKLVAVNYRRLAEVLGKNQIETLKMQYNLAWVLNLQGDKEKSLETYIEVYDKRKTFLGEEHESTIYAAYNLAGVFLDLKKFYEARQLYEKLFESLRKIKGEDHSRTVTTKQILARFLTEDGEWDLALGMFREVLECRQKELGEQHQDTLVTRHDIGDCLFHQGKYLEAEGFFNDVFEVSRANLGEENSITLNSMNMLGLTYYKQGDDEKAEKILQQVSRLKRRIIGSNHVKPDDSSGPAKPYPRWVLYVPFHLNRF